VWDAARPFTSVELAQSVLAAAQQTGAAAAVLADRSFQTPLAFTRELLLDVADIADEEAWVAPSTMALVLRAGHAVATVPGDPLNIKLTTAEDWTLAQTMLDRLA